MSIEGKIQVNMLGNPALVITSAANVFQEIEQISVNGWININYLLVGILASWIILAAPSHNKVIPGMIMRLNPEVSHQSISVDESNANT